MIDFSEQLNNIPEEDLNIKPSTAVIPEDLLSSALPVTEEAIISWFKNKEFIILNRMENPFYNNKIYRKMAMLIGDDYASFKKIYHDLSGYLTSIKMKPKMLDLLGKLKGFTNDKKILLEKNFGKLIITNKVLEKLSGNGIEAEKLTSHLGKEFTKKTLTNILINMNYNNEEINKIVDYASSIFLKEDFINKLQNLSLILNKDEGLEIWNELKEESPFIINLNQKDIGYFDRNSIRSIFEEFENNYLINSMTYECKKKRYYKVFMKKEKLEELTKFLTGMWLELYTYYKIDSLLMSNKYNKNDFFCLKNCEGEYEKNGKKKSFELDLFYFINVKEPDGARKVEPLWIECSAAQDYITYLNDKWDNYQYYLEKFKILRENFIMVFPYMDNNKIKAVNNYNSLWKDKMILANLDENSNERLKENPNENSDENSNENSFLFEVKKFLYIIFDKKGILKNIKEMLSSANILPNPNIRSEVINNLLVFDFSMGKNLQTIKFELAQRFNVRKHFIHNILNALLRSNSFKDENGDYIKSIGSDDGKPVKSLCGNDFYQLEKNCIRSYIMAILGKNFKLFDFRYRVELFKEYTGTTVDKETIKDIIRECKKVI